MEYKKIATGLNNIDFLAAQSDCPYENEKIVWLLHQLENIEAKHSLRILLKVLEVKDLKLRTGPNFKTLFGENILGSSIEDFPFIEEQVNYYNTEDYKKKSS